MRRTIFRTLLALGGIVAIWIAVAVLAGTIAQLRVPVNLTTYSGVTSVSDGYVKAAGTWVIEGDRQGFPLQTTEITCKRELKRCSSATAQIMLGNQLRYS